MLAAIRSIWFNVAAFSLLFCTIVLFAYTGQYYFLAIPVAFLYVVLLVKTWLLVCFFVLPLYIFTEKKDFIKGFLLMLVPMLATVIVILIHHYLLGFKFAKVEKAISGLYYNHVDYSTVISMFFPLLL